MSTRQKLYITVSLFHCQRFRLLPDPHEHHYEMVRKILHASGIVDPLKREEYPYERLLIILVERLNHQINQVYALDVETKLILNSSSMHVNVYGVTPGLLTILDNVRHDETCDQLFNRFTAYNKGGKKPSYPFPTLHRPDLYEFQRLQSENESLKAKLQERKEKSNHQTQDCGQLIGIYQSRLKKLSSTGPSVEEKNLDLSRKYESLQAREDLLTSRLRRMRGMLNLGQDADLQQIVQKIQELKTLLKNCQDQKKVVSRLQETGPY